MRAVRLAIVAFHAERVRIGLFLHRTAVRLVLAMAAAIFLLFGLIAGEASLYMALADYLTRAQSMLALAALNIAIALTLVGLAANSRPGMAERESRELARAASREMLPSLSIIPTAVILVRTILAWLNRGER